LGGTTSGGAGGSGRGGAGAATSGGAGGSGGGAGNGDVGAGGAPGSGAGGSGAGGMTGDAGIDAATDAAGASGTDLIPGSGSLCSNTAAATGAKVITVDGKSAGRIFDAIGGLSGGGGTSRLLYDYPPQQQSEVDYLFKPGYGAALHLLKVEIGSDTDTTNGAEASHERTATDRNYKRGYEWWLMEEAKKRNPAIKLYGLEWGAPGWLGKGIYTSANITYLVDWITNAQSVHGLTIDYIGGWNEEGGSGNASGSSNSNRRCAVRVFRRRSSPPIRQTPGQWRPA
jgi:hypothetical protein